MQVLPPAFQKKNAADEHHTEITWNYFQPENMFKDVSV